MAEGGVLPWKIQAIDESRGPAANFRGMHNPLPNPPKGHVWYQNPKTKEWSVVPMVTTGANTITKPAKFVAVEGVPVENKRDVKESPKNYLEHIVVPTDTFQGICLRYKISPIELRRANRFSGSNLLLAPSKLFIPVSPDYVPVVSQHERTPEYQIAKLLSTVPGLSRKEGKAYLELNDWDTEAAIKHAQDDVCEEQKR